MFAGGMGITEILIILFIVFIIFGAGKIPEVASGLGKGIRSFKKGITGIEDKNDEPIEEENFAESHTGK